MLDTIKRDWRPVLFQSIVTAVAFVGLIIAAALLLPNNEEKFLGDIRDAARAEVCVLSLPIGEMGRSETGVNLCLTQNGLAPLGG